MAERAHAFGLQVYAIRRPGRGADIESRLNAMGARFVTDLSELAEACDILSFHIPAAAETKGLINRELLSHVKPGAVIINTSRGDIVDEAALIEAMDRKGIRAGLDVYDAEPAAGRGEFSSALARHPNIYGTHHIGASTMQAQNAVAEGVVEVLESFVKGQVLHCVNRNA